MASVIFIKLERDAERTTPRWEIEFVIGDLQYEYEINAINGAILKFKTKKIHPRLIIKSKRLPF